MSAEAPAMPEYRPLTGILWMIATGFCFITVNVIVKHVGQTVPPAQGAFLRFLTGLVFLAPMLPATWRAGFAPGLVLRFCLRGTFQAIGSIFWFAAMALIPMGEVTAMGYLTPVFVTVGAAIFLGERLAARRIAAVACALIGALIVVRPGFREVTLGHLAMLASAPAFACSYLLAKRLSVETSAAATVTWMSVVVTLVLAPFAVLQWQPVGWVEVGWFAVTAAVATMAHYTMMLAFRAAPITVTQPVTFLQLVWSVSLGALLFAEPVDAFVLLGGGVILASVVFIAWREARQRRMA